MKFNTQAIFIAENDSSKLWLIFVFQQGLRGPSSLVLWGLKSFLSSSIRQFKRSVFSCEDPASKYYKSCYVVEQPSQVFILNVYKSTKDFLVALIKIATSFIPQFVTSKIQLLHIYNLQILCLHAEKERKHWMTQPLELPTKRKEGKVNDYRPQTSSETEAILAVKDK